MFVVHGVLINAPAGLRIKENKEVYEGEVTELTPEFTESEVRCWGHGFRLGMPAQVYHTTKQWPTQPLAWRAAAASQHTLQAVIMQRPGLVLSSTYPYGLWCASACVTLSCVPSQPVPSCPGCWLWQGRVACDHRAQNSQGHKAAEAGPNHL